jgi:hypothetical protein
MFPPLDIHTLWIATRMPQERDNMNPERKLKLHGFSILHNVLRGMCLAPLSAMRKGKHSMKRISALGTLVLTLALWVGGCGSSSEGSARVVINGQTYEMGVQGVDCWAGPPIGSAIAGYDGVTDAPLVCRLNFQSRTVISDYLIISVSSVVSVYRNSLGIWIPFLHGSVWAELSFQGLPETMSMGAIRFDSISNYAGDTVCASYEIQTANGLVEGQFCGRVREGY